MPWLPAVVNLRFALYSIRSHENPWIPATRFRGHTSREGRRGCPARCTGRYDSVVLVEPRPKTGSPVGGAPSVMCNCQDFDAPFRLSVLKFRDSKCLNQAMDSRFRGNDVISARRVAFRLVVIPAKAGIHFGQRIPKLESAENGERKSLHAYSSDLRVIIDPVAMRAGAYLVHTCCSTCSNSAGYLAPSPAFRAS